MIRRILIVLLLVVFVFSLFSVFASAIDPVSTGMALASAIDAYGMAYGIGSVYDVADANGVVTSFDGLWDEFSLYQSNNGDSYNYQDYYDNFDDSPSIQAFSHSSGKFAGFYLDAESAEVFDKFWNWLLSGPAEMVKVDNSYQWNVDSQTGEIVSPVVISVTEIPGIPFASTTSADSVLAYTSLVSGPPTTALTVYTSQSEVVLYSFCITYGGKICAVIVGESPANVSMNKFRLSDQSFRGGHVLSAGTLDNDTGLYYGIEQTWSAAESTSQLLVPYYDTLADGLASVLSDYPSTIRLEPYDSSDAIITLPDVSSPDYVPAPIEIITNVPWDDSYDDTDEDENGQPMPFPPSSVSPVVGDMISSIIEDGFSIEEDPQPSVPDSPPPAPSEVFTPLLPVSPPSFDFNFAGIWHYVREWVASLGAWFSLVFTVWSILPYAIVVPVYATAVVVIVLGVYKRFFM